jgi:hypothetical protein
MLKSEHDLPNDARAIIRFRLAQTMPHQQRELHEENRLWAVVRAIVHEAGRFPDPLDAGRLGQSFTLVDRRVATRREPNSAVGYWPVLASWSHSTAVS